VVSEVLMAVVTRITVFWDMMLYRLMFQRKYFPEDGGSAFLC
jgi:hypothetical protein